LAASLSNFPAVQINRRQSPTYKLPTGSAEATALNTMKFR